MIRRYGQIVSEQKFEVCGVTCFHSFYGLLLSSIHLVIVKWRCSWQIFRVVGSQLCALGHSCVLVVFNTHLLPETINNQIMSLLLTNLKENHSWSPFLHDMYLYIDVQSCYRIVVWRKVHDIQHICVVFCVSVNSSSLNMAYYYAFCS